MSFRIAVTHPEIENDENVYHAILFINPDITIGKKLTYSSVSGKLEANFDFSQNPLKESQNQNLLVILVSVEEGEEIDKVQYKIVKSSLQNIQTVDF